ncbi:monovalent cation/H(+) antiporter subunit G [Brevibacterium ravenspurgense]|uniref:monovalent cation/H(+) antiporter subunit G n=1 Tax=Brevibacterium ravenspurgense TaxID=479117 RepID=UPI0009EF6170|nr:monovalent cation/H(+) antiporter subunit G [Brevibacterium ravenspurgense]
MSLIVSIILGALILLSGVLSIAAAAGLVRFPDLLSRLHSGSKPQVFGLISVLLVVAVTQPSFGLITTCLLIAGFQMATAPVGAHMVGRAGYRTRHLRRAQLYRDELADAVSRAEAREATALAESAEPGAGDTDSHEAPHGSAEDARGSLDVGGADPSGPESQAAHSEGAGADSAAEDSNSGTVKGDVRE